MTTVQITKVSERELCDTSAFDGHAQVLRFQDETSQLQGFVALHRKRGILAIGGTRFFPYADSAAALEDALGLSRAMTAKCIISGLPYGGGKAVIIGDPAKIKKPELLSAYAKVIDSLGGAFRTGEDVGMSEDDVQFLLTKSKYFIGKSDSAGDPSPYAGLSTFLVMKEAVRLHLKKDLLGTVVAVKGLGKVGSALVGHLVSVGAKVVVADIDTKAVGKIAKKYPTVTIVLPKDIHRSTCDVFAPCAMGDEVRKDNLEEFRAKIICGGANNQLADISLDASLAKKGILFIPDYLANAGGLINVADELEVGGYSKKRVMEKIDKLPRLLEKFYNLAQAKSVTLNEEAESMVRIETKN